LLAVSDNGYNVCVGSTVAHPVLFPSYEKHPMIRSKKLNSDAAGRYQFMGKFWAFYKKTLGLPDFGPASQDRWALQLIGECRALALIDSGNLEAAISACRSRWASLPGAGYGQPEHFYSALEKAYTDAGGILTA
jgi:muramidase (phage lysozyme)